MIIAFNSVHQEPNTMPNAQWQQETAPSPSVGVTSLREQEYCRLALSQGSVFATSQLPKGLVLNSNERVHHDGLVAR
jgi:hypothetical protein